MQPRLKGAELARRGRGEISTATAVPHVSYDDLRHADRIVIDGLEVFANHGVYPEENALGQKFIVSLVLYADLRAAGEHDNLDASIDYGSVCHDVDGYLREHTFKKAYRGGSRGCGPDAAAPLSLAAWCAHQAR